MSRDVLATELEPGDYLPVHRHRIEATAERRFDGGGLAVAVIFEPCTNPACACCEMFEAGETVTIEGEPLHG